jgi:UDP-glucose 4-epimerase
MMEKVATGKTRLQSCGDTVIAVTRYGNVMCSRGSVIPLFISQVKKGQPLTVTDPNMTRFMMSLDDAVNLVLFAFQNAKGGELFIQKAPASTIADLAETVRELFDGKEEIRYIGTRHGEKLYESLLTREEMAKAVDLKNYYMVPLDTRDLNYSNYFINGQERVSKSENYTSHNTKRLSRKEVKDLLLSLEYVQKALKGGDTGEGY